MDRPVADTVARPVAEASPTKLGEVDLALLAPRNEAVELLAEWNQFKPIAMAKGDDGWWRARAELPDGNYRYRFRVKSRSWFAEDQWVEVGDPYALELGERESDDALVRVKDGKRTWVDYQWQHDKVPLPTNDHLVIYEMHVGDFTGTPEHVGTFHAAISRLDYLRELGFNAIELMPVKEFPGRGWGYSLKTLFAIEQTYGRPENLCEFVDECHARGIRVIMDGVYNHMHMDAWMAKIDYELWFYRDCPDPPEMDYGPKFNYQYHDEQLGYCPARRYVTDSIQFMIEKYHVDGIRFDCTRAIREFDILSDLTRSAYEMVQERKPFICIAEHVPEDPAIAGRDRGAPMDAAWCDNLCHRLQSVLSFREEGGIHPDDIEGLAKAFDPGSNGYESAFRMVTFIGNHDHDSPMRLLGNAGVFEDAAFRRMRLGHALILFGPGIPLVWMGSEFGESREKTLEPLPLDWSLTNHERNADLLEFHRSAINLRHQVPALRSGNFEVVLRDDARKVLVFKRWNDEGSVALVAANCSDDAVEGISIAGEAHSYLDALSGETIKAKEGAVTISLEPSGVRLLVQT